MMHRPRSVARLGSVLRVVACIGVCWVVAGCAGYASYRDGRADIEQGNLESGLAKLKKAAEASPQNNEYRQQYFVQREAMVGARLRQADLAIERGDFAGARAAYALALELEAGNARAMAGAERVAVAQRHWGALEAAQVSAQKGDIEAALDTTRQVLSENSRQPRAITQLRQLMRLQADKTGKELGIYPKLRQAYRKPVSLSFANASLLQVFESLKLASGLNYILDKDVRPDLRVTLSVTNKPVEDILRLLLATNQLDRRVLDEDTLLIYPNTPAKAAEYREMVVRTFYLSNAEAAKVANVVKTLTKAKDVVIDEKLNLVIVRDSAEVIRMAEKLIATQDMAEPEVMLELEVLEVSVNRLVEMGISWPSSVSTSIVGPSGLGQLTLQELRNRNEGMVRLSTNNPAIAAQLRSQKGDANLLANPRVRVRNKQAAKILIGERVPVFTTSTTANVGTSESVNYLDVGLKLEIEPTISLDDEVSMKLALEVSNILETITRASGTQAYRLGTRNTSTSLRVRDGETNILAGLIQRDERRSNTGIPGLNEVPIVSKLFGMAQDSDTRTEIILLVTPHIVRNIDVPGVGLQEFLSGTDTALGASPIQLGAPKGDMVRPVPPQMAPPAVPGSAAPQPVRPTPVSPSPGLRPPPLVPTSPGAAPSSQTGEGR